MSLIGYPEAARLIGVPIGTVYAWVSQKRIPHLRLSKRLVRFDPIELESWIQQYRVDVAERPRNKTSDLKEGFEATP